MNVKLISYNPDAEKIIATAAKLCYSSSDIDSIMDDLTEDNVESFLNMLVSMEHESPVEHCNFTFGIEGVSRTLTHQLVRHRIASYSQRSQRYVKEGQFEYIVPPEIEKIPEAKELFIKSMERDQKDYDSLVNILKEHHKTELFKQFNDKYGDFGQDVEAYSKAIKKVLGQAEKMAIEDARYVLSNACETKIMVTMNARTLYNFFHHRCCERAQWEIRAMANQMLLLVKEVAPTLFKYAGPSCVKGTCPEGAMSCGNIKKYK